MAAYQVKKNISEGDATRETQIHSSWVVIWKKKTNKLKYLCNLSSCELRKLLLSVKKCNYLPNSKNV